MREVDEDWIDEYLRPRFPELVAPYIQAQKAISESRLSQCIEQENRTILLRACSSSRRPLSENVAQMLGHLDSKVKSVDEVIRDLFESKLACARISAIIALGCRKIANIHKEILPRALRDRSNKVRQLAADLIGELKLTEFAPLLQKAAPFERDKGAQETLLFEANMLSNGYVVEDMGDNVCITVRKGRSLLGQFFKKEELETAGKAFIQKHAGKV